MSKPISNPSGNTERWLFARVVSRTDATVILEQRTWVEAPSWFRARELAQKKMRSEDVEMIEGPYT